MGKYEDYLNRAIELLRFVENEVNYEAKTAHASASIAYTLLAAEIRNVGDANGASSNYGEIKLKRNGVEF